MPYIRSPVCKISTRLHQKSWTWESKWVGEADNREANNTIAKQMVNICRLSFCCSLPIGLPTLPSQPKPLPVQQSWFCPLAAASALGHHFRELCPPLPSRPSQLWSNVSSNSMHLALVLVACLCSVRHLVLTTIRIWPGRDIPPKVIYWRLGPESDQKHPGLSWACGFSPQAQA